MRHVLALLAVTYHQVPPKEEVRAQTSGRDGLDEKSLERRIGALQKKRQHSITMNAAHPTLDLVMAWEVCQRNLAKAKDLLHQLDMLE
ncbi:hypothetical protein P7K49_038440 [Saguinus oedipus]|uniref:Uncharacterized protein n=1 Tax=Saguinus oedipus TaxID=9490 RepID=A0ABQ9TEP1_SAGOE|nr:hypothetical protein P7K49_038440 [Saguinus oedipus]